MTEAPAHRVTVRSVVVPAEHGGWGLTLEPGILGVLVAPGSAGVLLAVAALLLFLSRTPLRILLVARARDSRATTAIGAERRRLAVRVAAGELVVATAAVLAAAVLAEGAWWWLPGLLAAPLLLLALWFDMHARSRHLVAEVAGSIALASVASMAALAGGASWPVATGLWLILGARVLTSVPHVRAQVLRIHGKAAPPGPTVVADAAALATALAAALLEPTLMLGAISIAILVAVQQFTMHRPPRPARVLGARQMILGFGVVALTAAGVWLL